MDDSYNPEKIKSFIKNLNVSLSTFIDKHKSVYHTTKKLGIWDECKNFLKPIRNPKYTKEYILEEAKKYNSRYQLQLEANHIYNSAIRYDLIDEACAHMLPVRFSIPQMICKDIFDHILNLDGLYNECNIIYPQELDIFYPTLNLGIEYDGIFHYDESRPEFLPNSIRDSIKNQVCKDKNIHLIRIRQLSDNRRNYKDIEIDIKNQIIENLSFIRSLADIDISKESVTDYMVNINKFYDMYNLDTITELSKKYHNVKEFMKNHKGLYNMLCKIGRLDILDHLRGKKDHFVWASKTDEEVVDYISTNYDSYNDAFNTRKINAIIFRRKISKQLRESFLSKNKK